MLFGSDSHLEYLLLRDVNYFFVVIFSFNIFDSCWVCLIMVCDNGSARQSKAVFLFRQLELLV